MFGSVSRSLLRLTSVGLKPTSLRPYVAAQRLESTAVAPQSFQRVLTLNGSIDDVINDFLQFSLYIFIIDLQNIPGSKKKVIVLY